jgi:hypothetical protein
MYKIRFLPHREHNVACFVMKNLLNILMFYGEINAVFSQIHTKHINTLCGQNVELLNVKPGDTYK